MPKASENVYLTGTYIFMEAETQFKNRNKIWIISRGFRKKKAEAEKGSDHLNKKFPFRHVETWVLRTPILGTYPIPPVS